MEVDYVNTIYLPQYSSSSCVSLDNLNNGFVRVYSSSPSTNSTRTYVDYFINSHYISRSGSQTFGNTVNITCVSNSLLTKNIWYRNDIFDIVGTYFIIIFILSFILTKFFGVFRKRSRL